MSVTVFLDKDGTLLEDIPYNVDPQRMRLAPLGDRALRLLAEYDCRVVVVSNQSGVARGYFSESSLERVEDWLRTVFRRFGVDFAGFYYCPHHPEGDVAEFAIECDCRKPGDGMLRRAAADLGIDLSEAWMVGDILDDVEAGNRAGCRTILIDNDNETEWRLSTLRWPTVVVRNLESAARAIVDDIVTHSARRPRSRSVA
ncbi:MAG: HAD family hydrolase [Dehalococcoidia bacterium]|nr:HAD family hydrolase [Dehalococcoidia bacterium]MCB9490637.1 HAD family hydrolase [Dehalococcoidia bacterium]